MCSKTDRASETARAPSRGLFLFVFKNVIEMRRAISVKTGVDVRYVETGRASFPTMFETNLFASASVGSYERSTTF